MIFRNPQSVKKNIWQIEEPEICICIQCVGKLLKRAREISGSDWKYKKAIEFDPKSSWPYVYWGDALLGKQKYDEAIEQYEIAKSLEPDIPEIYYGWGIALKNKQMSIVEPALKTNT